MKIGLDLAEILRISKLEDWVIFNVRYHFDRLKLTWIVISPAMSMDIAKTINMVI